MVSSHSVFSTFIRVFIIKTIKLISWNTKYPVLLTAFKVKKALCSVCIHVLHSIQTVLRIGVPREIHQEGRYGNETSVLKLRRCKHHMSEMSTCVSN